MVAAPGYTDVGDSYDALLSHCENLGDRVAILDGPLVGRRHRAPDARRDGDRRGRHRPPGQGGRGV